MQCTLCRRSLLVPDPLSWKSNLLLNGKETNPHLHFTLLQTWQVCIQISMLKDGITVLHENLQDCQFSWRCQLQMPKLTFQWFPTIWLLLRWWYWCWCWWWWRWYWCCEESFKVLIRTLVLVAISGDGRGQWGWGVGWWIFAKWKKSGRNTNKKRRKFFT